jgi:RHS repeat-associated protein
VLQLSESEVATPDLPARDLETRIGPSGFSGATRTEPLSFVSGTSNRACGDRAAEIAMGSSSPSIDEPLALYASGAVSYLNADGLGSIVATNNTTGTVTHNSVFDAWGVAKSETGTRIHSFTYTGREVGEAGLHGYRARLLDPARGRFTSGDAIPSTRPYAYVFSSPPGNLDHFGRWPSTAGRGPYGGTVHQNAIDRALSNLTSRDRDYLKWIVQFADADVFQSEANSFMHAMSRPGQSINDAWREANCYVSRLMRDAMELERKGLHMAALRKFGMALHTIQDATSPSHFFFQTWFDPLNSGGPGDMASRGLNAGVDHLKSENYDPGFGSRLDTATKWLWDVFSGSVSIPQDYFADIRADAPKAPNGLPW